MHIYLISSVGYFKSPILLENLYPSWVNIQHVFGNSMALTQQLRREGQDGVVACMQVCSSFFLFIRLSNAHKYFLLHIFPVKVFIKSIHSYITLGLSDLFV